MKKILSVLLVCLIIGCTQPIIIEEGDNVSLEYSGTLSDGSEFDSNVGGEALTFTAGVGQMISGFDNAVLGMSVGETKTFTLSPSEAYGEYDTELITNITISELETIIGQEVEVGMILTNAYGMMGTITNIVNNTVFIDFNHQLAGENLTFTITILEITKN